MKIYLAGAMSGDPKCREWRDYLTAQLPSHNMWNPLNVLFEDSHFRQQYYAARNTANCGDMHALNRFRDMVRNVIIPADLEGLLWCDALVCYMKRDIRLFGAICEISEVKMNLGKPVYLISDFAYSEMSSWEIGLSDEIFRNIDEAVEFLRKLS